MPVRAQLADFPTLELNRLPVERTTFELSRLPPSLILYAGESLTIPFVLAALGGELDTIALLAPRGGLRDWGQRGRQLKIPVPRCSPEGRISTIGCLSSFVVLLVLACKPWSLPGCGSFLSK